jgi:hypothetical protein
MYKYNNEFEPMISTNRILAKFSKSRRRHGPFSFASEIFRMEHRTIVVLVILSILAGLTSLVPIYFQFVLVKAVMGNTGQFYSLAVIVCVMFLRFILLNVSQQINSVRPQSLEQYRTQHQNIYAELIYAGRLRQQ